MKTLRMSRLFCQKGKTLMLPMDHGLTMGPLSGIRSVDEIGPWLEGAPVNAVVAHKGLMIRLIESDLCRGIGTILHLNGMNGLAKDIHDKPILTSLATARLLGVDAVSVQLNFDGKVDRENWRLLGQVSDRCIAWGMPLMVMLYDATDGIADQDRGERFRSLARACWELGTDILKVSVADAPEALLPAIAEVGRDVRVVVAGGPVTDLSKVNKWAVKVLSHGASGLCVGRNIFSQSNPRTAIKHLSRLVHRTNLDARRGESIAWG